MPSMRRLPANRVHPQPCCRCGDSTMRWDQLARKTYCPNCLEELAAGNADPPLSEPTQKGVCAACNHVGTISFLTWPLNRDDPVEFDLCNEHVQAVAGRRLRPYPFELLKNQLIELGLDVSQIFLLHGAFYNQDGAALQPVLPVEDIQR